MAAFGIRSCEDLPFVQKNRLTVATSCCSQLYVSFTISEKEPLFRIIFGRVHKVSDSGDHSNSKQQDFCKFCIEHSGIAKLWVQLCQLHRVLQWMADWKPLKALSCVHSVVQTSQEWQEWQTELGLVNLQQLEDSQDSRLDIVTLSSLPAKPLSSVAGWHTSAVHLVKTRPPCLKFNVQCANDLKVKSFGKERQTWDCSGDTKRLSSEAATQDKTIYVESENTKEFHSTVGQNSVRQSVWSCPPNVWEEVWAENLPETKDTWSKPSSTGQVMSA